MADLNETLKEITSKNAKIRERLHAQGIDKNETSNRGDLASTSRLSYGVFLTQDFLSSTRLSVSNVPGEPTKTLDTTKRLKVQKKVKKKFREEIQFSSEEDELASMLGSQPNPKKVVKKKTKTPSKLSLKKGPAKAEDADNHTNPSKTKRIPLTPKQENHNIENVKISSKKLSSQNSESPRRTKKTVKTSKGTKITSKKGPQQKSSEESLCPDTESSSRSNISSSLSSSVASAASTSLIKSSKKSSVKKAKPPKKKPAFLQAIHYSSESDNSDVEKKNVEANLKKLREILSSRSSINTSTESDAGKHLRSNEKQCNRKSRIHLRRIVMESDSADEEVQDIVPDTQHRGEDHSEDSVDEAFVTIPCSQDEENPKIRRSCQKLIANSEDNDEGNMAESDSKTKAEILVQDTESPELDDVPIEGSEATVPCSQEEKQVITPSQDSSERTGVNENFVTIVQASNQLQKKKLSTTFFHDTETGESEESLETDQNPKSYVPDSEIVNDDTGTDKAFPDSEVVVQDSEVMVSDSEVIVADSEIVNDSEVVVPDSEVVPSDCEVVVPESEIQDDINQDEFNDRNKGSDACDVTSENREATAPAVSTDINSTPSLVSRIVSFVRTAASSPVQRLFGSSPRASPHNPDSTDRPTSAKKLDKQFQQSRVMKSAEKPTPSSSKGKKFFDIIQYSSDEENTPPQEEKSISDHSSVHDSSSQLSCYDKSDIQELSQRLQNILSKSTKKKKLTKTAKGKKKASSKKVKTISDISDGSFEKLAQKDSVLIPESQPCNSSDPLTNDSGVEPLVIEDSQSLNILVPDSESLDSDPKMKAPDISIPDSQQTNLHLELSLTRSESSSIPQSQENTVRHIPPKSLKKTATESLVHHDTTSSDVYSMEIPYCGPQKDMPVYRQQEGSTDEFSLDKQEAKANNPIQTAEISLQVSMMSPGDECYDNSNSDGSGEEVQPSQREISLQVSVAGDRSEQPSSPVGHDSTKDSFISQPDPNEQIDPSSSVKAVSFCMQVSMTESPQEENPQKISYNGSADQDKLEDISTEMKGVSRTLQRELENEVSCEAGLEENDAWSSSDEEREDEDDETGQKKISLEVSMCIEGRSPRKRNRSVHALEESIIEVGPDNEQAQEKNQNDSDKDSGEGYISFDDSDADPDFVVSPVKNKNAKRSPKSKGTTQRSTSKTRKKNRSGSKSGEEKENLPEAQATKTVLLCDKKESVMGAAADLDDDFSLPDLSPPRLAPRSSRKQLSSESSEDEPCRERRKTPKPRKDSSFIVDDSDITSGEEEDDGNSVFYSRVDRQLENERAPTHNQSSIFKTPIRIPSNKRGDWTPQPGPSLVNSKVSSKTPGPGRTQPQASTDNLRSHSTGHLPQYFSFLKSLSSDVQDKQRNPEAKRYVNDFKKRKEELTEKLFKLYNETVFEGQLPADLPIKWNSRLLTTAGYCAYKRDKTADNQRVARIELSGKVCDSAERVRDTLIHELCHAAVWLTYGKHDGHGRYWQAFARKAERAHLDLPPISRCHMYDINHKFIYKCTKCGQQIGRHTKSLNTDKKVCGICHGKFEVHINTPKGLTPHKPRTPRTPNAFALFVKENYNTIKQSNTGFKHADVMKALSAEFATKAKVT